MRQLCCLHNADIPSAHKLEVTAQPEHREDAFGEVDAFGRTEPKPRAWFSSIALNLCRHYLRDKNKEAELADSAKLERGGRVGRPRTRGALSSAVRRETNRLLAVALGYLTQAQREVFVLHYVDDLPYEEVSQILEIRPGAARALAHRAKAVLQKQLGPALDALAKS